MTLHTENTQETFGLAGDHPSCRFSVAPMLDGTYFHVLYGFLGIEAY